jgi:hypothetical protein
MTPVGRSVAAVAERLRVTEGQVYTAVIGALVALAAAVGGIPPALAKHHVVPAQPTTTVIERNSPPSE